MKNVFRYASVVGALLVLAVWLYTSIPANADDHIKLAGMLPEDIVTLLGEKFNTLEPYNEDDRPGYPNPEDFEFLLELKIEPIGASADLPAYFKINGTLFPEITFELRLPPRTEWNKKFYMTGCGGFCGDIDIKPASQFTNNLNWGLVRGYASSTTDSGHSSFVIDPDTGELVNKGVMYAEWAFNNLPGEIDWGYRSVHEVTRVCKALIYLFYHKSAMYSYFSGCSTGGRQAMVEALRFPKDFDGIISGAPALDYTGLVATWTSWIVQKVGNNKFSADDLDVIRQAVLARCDGVDGEVDGMISDPRGCPEINFNEFDPPLNLSSNQIEALHQIYSKPINSSGEILYEGAVPYGSEIYWPIYMPGTESTPENPLGMDAIRMFNDGFLKYAAFEVDNPNFTANDFNFDTTPATLEFMGKIYNATSTDLRKYKKMGGKIFMYHGWADSLCPPIYTIDYYNRVVAAMGGLKETQDFFRLFMVPGMDHCSVAKRVGGTSIGLDDFDALGALEKWVEEGIAPDEILASGKTFENPPRSRSRYLKPYSPGDKKD